MSITKKEKKQTKCVAALGRMHNNGHGFTTAFFPPGAVIKCPDEIEYTQQQQQRMHVSIFVVAYNMLEYVHTHASIASNKYANASLVSLSACGRFSSSFGLWTGGR